MSSSCTARRFNEKRCQYHNCTHRTWRRRGGAIAVGHHLVPHTLGAADDFSHPRNQDIDTLCEGRILRIALHVEGLHLCRKMGQQLQHTGTIFIFIQKEREHNIRNREKRTFLTTGSPMRSIITRSGLAVMSSPNTKADPCIRQSSTPTKRTSVKRTPHVGTSKFPPYTHTQERRNSGWQGQHRTSFLVIPFWLQNSMASA